MRARVCRHRYPFYNRSLFSHAYHYNLYVFSAQSVICKWSASYPPLPSLLERGPMEQTYVRRSLPFHVLAVSFNWTYGDPISSTFSPVNYHSYLTC